MTVLFASLPKLVVALLKLLMVGAVLFLFSFHLALVMVGLGVVFYGVTKVVADKVMYRNSTRIQEVYEGQNVVGNEAVTGIREIKIRDAQFNWAERFRQHATELYRLYFRNDVFRSLPASALQIGFMACLLIIFLWKRDTLSTQMVEYVPLVGLYFYAFMRVAPSLTEIATLKLLIAERRPYAEAVYKELQTQSCKSQDGHGIVKELTTGIVFDRVSFTYPGRERTLCDIDISFRKGETTASSATP